MKDTFVDWIIDVKDLCKSFANQPAVTNLSLQIGRGEVFGFLGPNGTGKTTTIRMLCGLLTPDSGSGHCMGYDIIKQSTLIKSQVGYMTQVFSLYKELTIYENLEFRAKIHGLKNYELLIENAMQQLGLEQRRNQRAGTLSLGWKQRLSLAAATIHQPLLLLLDEPTAGVDPNARRDFWELIHDLSNKGTTILLSTHNMDEVQKCDRIAYMGKGHIIAHGTPEQIIKKINLMTWSVTGPNLPLLTKQLEQLPGVDLVTTFYGAIHVSGVDHELLKKSISPYLSNANYHWKLDSTSLEEIFIWLTDPSRINSQQQ